MNRQKSIRFKAAFLMVVFSLNTIIGFACALGIDMKFNTSHHHEEEATKTSVHIHADGKKHIHQEKSKHHDETAKNHHNSKDKKDNCCNDEVMKFNEVDKSASHSLSQTISPIFFAIFVGSFYHINISYTSYIDTGIKYFVRSYHPPISDIRIAIRSFQI